MNEEYMPNDVVSKMVESAKEAVGGIVAEDFIGRGEIEPQSDYGASRDFTVGMPIQQPGYIGYCRLTLSIRHARK